MNPDGIATSDGHSSVDEAERVASELLAYMPALAASIFGPGNASPRLRQMEMRHVRRQSAVAVLGARPVSGDVTLPELIDDGARLRRGTLGIGYAAFAEPGHRERFVVRAETSGTIRRRLFPVAGRHLEAASNHAACHIRLRRSASELSTGVVRPYSEARA